MEVNSDHRSKFSNLSNWKEYSARMILVSVVPVLRIRSQHSSGNFPSSVGKTVLYREIGTSSYLYLTHFILLSLNQRLKQFKFIVKSLFIIKGSDK